MPNILRNFTRQSSKLNNPAVVALAAAACRALKRAVGWMKIAGIDDLEYRINTGSPGRLIA